MLANLRMTVTESIRYRGRSGHYSWLLHRVSGLSILFFLLIHAWDGANLHYAPHLWAWLVDIFKHPLFGVGEIVIFASVIFHAFNGIRITILDFKPEWWHHQERSARIVWAISILIIAPAAIYLMSGIIASCGHAPEWKWMGETLVGNSCWSLPPLSHYTPIP